MSLPAGTKLGPYEILAPLGVRGMGEVYRASDSRLGREVAVKVLPKDADSHTKRERFLRRALELGFLRQQLLRNPESGPSARRLTTAGWRGPGPISGVKGLRTRGGCVPESSR